MRFDFLRGFLIPACLLVFSCGKPETDNGGSDPGPVPQSESIRLSSSSLSLDADAGIASITVTSSGAWSVDDKYPVSWVTSVDPASGEAGESKVAITYIANESELPRSGRITFVTGEKSATVSLTQAGGMKKPDPDPGTDYKDGLPARWETFSTSEQSAWSSGHKFASNLGANKGAATMTAVSDSRTLDFVVSSSAPAVGNLGENDSFVWTVPVKSIAAGSVVDFMATFGATSNNVPKYWVCEILEDGQWKSVAADLKSADGVQYSFYVKNFSSYQYTSFVQSFTLSNALTNTELKIRCRAVGDKNAAGGALSPDGGAYVFLPVRPWVATAILAYDGVSVKDTRKAAFLGNSFTYYFATHFMLKEIAASQGHQLRMRVHAKGSQYLEDHLSLEKSGEVYSETGYDFAFLQEQSVCHANYFLESNDMATVLSTTKSLAGKFPGAKIFLENTWAYPSVKDGVNWNGFGTGDAFFFCLQNGTKKLCAETGAVLSPIGIAFQKAYNSGFKDLWYSDSKHQARSGAYLKTCVNYLMLYGEKFDSNVPDCELSSSDAAKLRAIAESVVLGGYSIPGLSVAAPDATSFPAAGGSGSASVDADVEYSASSSATWLQVTKSDGKISWTLDENKNDSSRKGTVSVEAFGMPMKTIGITQAGMKPDTDPGLDSGIADLPGNDYSGYVK